MMKSIEGKSCKSFTNIFFGTVFMLTLLRPVSFKNTILLGGGWAERPIDRTCAYVPKFEMALVLYYID